MDIKPSPLFTTFISLLLALVSTLAKPAHSQPSSFASVERCQKAFPDNSIEFAYCMTIGNMANFDQQCFAQDPSGMVETFIFSTNKHLFSNKPADDTFRSANHTFTENWLPSTPCWDKRKAIQKTSETILLGSGYSASSYDALISTLFDERTFRGGNLLITGNRNHILYGQTESLFQPEHITLGSSYGIWAETNTSIIKNIRKSTGRNTPTQLRSCEVLFNFDDKIMEWCDFERLFKTSLFLHPRIEQERLHIDEFIMINSSLEQTLGYAVFIVKNEQEAQIIQSFMEWNAPDYELIKQHTQKGLPLFNIEDGSEHSLLSHGLLYQRIP